MRGYPETEQNGSTDPDLLHILTPSRPLSTDTQLTDWSSILGPYLVDTLAHHGSYSAQDIAHHLNFFARYVSQWLGAGPTYDPDTGAAVPPYPGSLTNDHTPFEVSCCWKSKQQQGKAIVRYVTDVIPSNEVSRLAAFTQALRVMTIFAQVASPKEEIKAKNTPYLRAFPHLWTKITEQMIANEQETHSHPCSRCSPSGVFIGFDLVGSATFAKSYWTFPACQSTNTLLSSVENIITTCVDTDPVNFPKLSKSWTKLADYIKAHQEIIQPRIVSVDATKFPIPRVKIYARRVFTETNRFGDIEPHLSLSGTVPVQEAFRRTCERLWGSLVGPGDAQPGKGPKYCLLLYELPTGAPGEDASKDISAKLYIMCQEIPRTDSFLAQKLQENCPVLQDAEVIGEFRKYADPTAFICEVGLAPRGAETEVSIYCSPCWSSRKTWKDCIEEDGGLRKVRRNLSKN